MSMTNDILGFGRSAFMESTDVLEPEIAEMKLKDVEDLDEGTDLMEFMTGVAYECDLNMRNLEMAIIADEYNYLKENGEEIVYEESRIQSVINKFKSSVKWLWEQIQKFHKTALKKIDDFLKLDQRFVEKYRSKAKGNTGLYKGVSIKEYATAIITASADIQRMVVESDRIATLYLKDANFTGLVKDEDDDTDDTDFVEVNMKTIYKNIFKTEAEENSSRAKDVYNTILSTYKSTKTIQKIDGGQACAELLTTKKMKESLKKLYSESKKVINSHIKAAKKAEKVTRKFKVIPTKLSSAVHKVVKILTTIGKWCTQANKFGVKNINMYRAAMKSAIVSAAALSSSKTSGKDSDSMHRDIDKGEANAHKELENSSALDLYEPGMTI